MCVIKIHAFTSVGRPPSWSETVPICYLPPFCSLFYRSVRLSLTFCLSISSVSARPWPALVPPLSNFLTVQPNPIWSCPILPLVHGVGGCMPCLVQRMLIAGLERCPAENSPQAGHLLETVPCTIFSKCVTILVLTIYNTLFLNN